MLMLNLRLPPQERFDSPFTPPAQAVRCRLNRASSPAPLSSLPSTPMVAGEAPHALSLLDFTHACWGSELQVVRIRGGMPSSQAVLPLLLRAVASIVIDGCAAALMLDRSSVWA